MQSLVRCRVLSQTTRPTSNHATTESLTVRPGDKFSGPYPFLRRIGRTHMGAGGDQMMTVALQVAGQGALLLGVLCFLRFLLPMCLDVVFSVVGGDKCENWIRTQKARKGVDDSAETK